MEPQLTEKSFSRPVPRDKRLRAPCQVACPINQDAQLYVQLIAEGKPDEALAVIRETNPLPQVIGRICARPCEKACRRGEVDEPIAICNLKRVAGDEAKALGAGFNPPETESDTGKSVAIIGSGPSGLAAAHNLALKGVKPVIFERQPLAGGFLRSGILSYRLPKEILDEDISYIEGMGAEIRTEVAIGEDISFDELADDYDAVLIAVGLAESRSLPIPGADLEGVLLAVPFLDDVNAGREVDIGKKIVVIGGGNVAIDVARSALRVSGGKVTMVCLEADYEMPAHSWEIEEAKDEGIEIVCSQGPNAIKGEGRVEALEVKKCEAVFDDEGRFAPRFCETELSSIECDTVIIAIGQMSNLGFLPKGGPETDERGILVFDRDNYTTTSYGVFVSGEVVTGPGAAVSAIGHGQRAATAILRHLGIDAEPYKPLEPVGELPASVKEKIKQSPRNHMPMRPAAERVKDFVEAETGMELADARSEASRCLLCAAGARYSELKCIGCLTCVRVCPYDAPWADKDGLGGISPEHCQACGICYTQCPAKAIDLKVRTEDGIAAEIEALVAGGAPVIELGCWFAKQQAAPDAVPVMLPCTSRLSSNLILRGLEAGAEKIIVAVCSECDNGKFVTGHRQTRAAVAEARQALADIGLSEDLVELWLVKEHRCLIGAGCEDK
ncbi:MAG: FAD-dependent oxidoreductase [Actinomycetota bacterium]